MALPLLPTTLVGSYPQPEWLIDRAKLSKMVPRVKMDDLWLVAPDQLGCREAAVAEADVLGLGQEGRDPRDRRLERVGRLALVAELGVVDGEAPAR